MLNNQQENFNILKVVILIIGAAFFLMGSVFALGDTMWVLRGTEIKAHIIDQVPVRGGRCPIFEYKIDGKTYTYQSFVCTPNFSIGDERSILYDPKHPAYADEPAIILELVFVVVGAIFIAYWRSLRSDESDHIPQMPYDTPDILSTDILSNENEIPRDIYDK